MSADSLSSADRLGPRASRQLAFCLEIWTNGKNDPRKTKTLGRKCSAQIQRRPRPAHTPSPIKQDAQTNRWQLHVSRCGWFLDRQPRCRGFLDQTNRASIDSRLPSINPAPPAAPVSSLAQHAGRTSRLPWLGETRATPRRRRVGRRRADVGTHSIGRPSSRHRQARDWIVRVRHGESVGTSCPSRPASTGTGGCSVRNQSLGVRPCLCGACV